MVAPIEGAALDAALYFYQQSKSLPPGSEGAEITEQAISIALRRSSNASSPSFRFDVWRNARYSYRRSHKRWRTAHAGLKLACGAGVVVGGRGGQTPPTPEDVFVAAELEEKLRTAATRIHPRGVRTLEGLLSGEREVETAAAIQATPRTVRRIRSAIRSEAERLTKGGYAWSPNQ